MIRRLISWLICGLLVLAGTMANYSLARADKGPRPFPDSSPVSDLNSCTSAIPLGVTSYSFVAPDAMGPSEAGPDYACGGALVAADWPNPTWFVVKVQGAGTLKLNASNNVGRDIDGMLWGPFSCADAKCGAALTAVKRVACDWTAAGSFSLTAAVPAGTNFYVLLVTNYSNKKQSTDLITTAGSTVSILYDDISKCIDCSAGVCAPLFFATEITNIYSKSYDVIVQNPVKANTSAADFAAEQAMLQKKFPGVPIVSGTFAQVITSLRASYNGLNRPIHVLVDGHGAPGRMQIGDGIISDNADGLHAGELANQNAFVDPATGLGRDAAHANRPRLANLDLLGCSVAAGQTGQAFLGKLSGQLGQISVKGFTGTVVFRQCTNKIMTDGSKKDVHVPGLPAWGMIVLSLLLLASGLWYASRRQRLA